MTTTPAPSSAHVIPVFANSLSHVACGRSHTMSVPAGNTRIISIHSDVILGRQPGYDIVLWLAKFALFATFISNPHSVHGPWYSWFARLPTTRIAHLAFQEPLSSHCSFVRAVIFAEIWRVFMWCFAGHYMSFFGSRSWLLLSCQQGSQFRNSLAKATSSDPGTCWSAHKKHLREFGLVFPFSLVRSVTDFRCWLELRAWIVRRAWRNST